MALIQCKNCGNPVSDKASKCPHCGLDPKISREQYLSEKKRHRKKLTRNIIIGIGGFILLYFIIDFIIIAANGCAIFYSEELPVDNFNPDNIHYSEDLVKRAEAGDSDAQADLGSCYSEGLGTERNISEAFKWFEKSADQANPKGLHRLANCYYNGWGVNQNIQKAISLYEEALKGGYKSSYFTMAIQYLAGKDVEKDEEKGLNYLKEAVKQEYIPAVSLYGELLLMDDDYRPKSLKKDIPLGVTNLERAAEANFAPAHLVLGLFCDTVSTLAVESKVENLRPQARAYYETAAQLGDTRAKSHLGYIYYYNGDKRNAMKWWCEAAKEGNPDAKKDYSKRFLIWEWL